MSGTWYRGVSSEGHRCGPSMTPPQGPTGLLIRCRYFSGEVSGAEDSGASVPTVLSLAPFVGVLGLRGISEVITETPMQGHSLDDELLRLLILGVLGFSTLSVISRNTVKVPPCVSFCSKLNRYTFYDLKFFVDPGCRLLTHGSFSSATKRPRVV